jgi:hypothetical protein
MKQHLSFTKYTLCLFTFFLVVTKAEAANRFSIAAGGNWSSTATWSTVCGGAGGSSIPVAGDVVVICSGTVTMDAVEACASLTINAGAALTFSGNNTLTVSGAIVVNGTLTTVNTGGSSATSVLQANGSVTVNGGGSLINGGQFNMAAGQSFILNGNAIYTHNPENNDATNETMFSNGVETFSATSTLNIQEWSSAALPLGDATRVGVSDFGNITISAGLVWDQDGKFAPSRIKGTLTVTSGQINMDDGTGATTSLTTGDIVTSGTGGIIFQQGASRNLTLTTGNFTHNGSGLASIMYLSYGTLNWTVNGNMSVSKDFTGIQGGGANVASSTIQVNGNFSVSGGLFDFNRQVTAPLSLTVTGTTTISGAPGWVRFVDGNSGTLNFTTNAFTISGGAANNLNLGTGATTITVTNDLTVNGTSTTYCVNNSTNVGNYTLNVGHDFIMSAAAGDFRTVYSNGSVAVNITRNFTLTGGNYFGQRYTLGTTPTSFIVGGDYTFNTATSTNVFEGTEGDGDYSMSITGGCNVLNNGKVYGIYNGDGNFTMNVGGIYTQATSTSAFWGVGGSGSSTGGNATITVGSYAFTGGVFVATSAHTTAAKMMQMNVTGNMDITFGAATDEVILVNNFSQGFPIATANLIGLDFNVNGNVTIGGNNSGIFFSSGSGTNETCDILGNLTVNGGNNYFVGTETAGNGHNIVTNVSGNLTVTGGFLRFSSLAGTADINLFANATISGGETTAKVNTGATTVDVSGNYVQTGGTFFLHKSTTTLTPDVVAVTINGTFSQTGTGIINFDQNISSTATHTLTLFGSSYTIGGTASMTHASAGTGSVFGELYFARTGTITLDRTATTHEIDQVRQIINSVCTLNASASTNDVQIACNSGAGVTTVTPTIIMMDINGILNMGAKLLFGRSPDATQRPTSLWLRSAAELQTSNNTGMYDGTTAATFVFETRNNANTVNTVNSFNWTLDANSTVTHNSAGNQVVTGKFPLNFTSSTNNDIASGTTATYKYGILNINNQGTVGTNYAFPANPAAGTGNVFVRTTLKLTRGELNLQGSGTGQTITIENSAIAAINRDGATTVGYIKSEEANAGNNRAIVQWNSGSTNGAYVIPFGVSTTYIPFTFTKTAGNSNMQFSTRATAANDNLPLAAISSVAAVANMNSAALGGANGAIPSTIDRWWNITAVAGPATVTADMIFTYRGIENTTTVAPLGTFKAQHWNGTYWDLPVGAGTGVTAGTGTVSVSGANTFSPWVLTAATAPLPIELVSFDAHLNLTSVDLNWETSSEINNDYFSLEKSIDGQNFDEFKKVKGAGNSTNDIKYADVDPNPFIGITYYRLKQTDFDGHFTYSNIAPVEYNPNGDPSIFLYPNPTSGATSTTLVMNSLENQEVLVVLRDMMGRELFSKVITCSTSNQILAVDPDGKLAKGSYTVTVTSTKKLYCKKLIVK